MPLKWNKTDHFTLVDVMPFNQNYCQNQTTLQPSKSGFSYKENYFLQVLLSHISQKYTRAGTLPRGLTHDLVHDWFMLLRAWACNVHALKIMNCSWSQRTFHAPEIMKASWSQRTFFTLLRSWEFHAPGGHSMISRAWTWGLYDLESITGPWS